MMGVLPRTRLIAPWRYAQATSAARRLCKTTLGSQMAHPGPQLAGALLLSSSNRRRSTRAKRLAPRGTLGFRMGCTLPDHCPTIARPLPDTLPGTLPHRPKQGFRKFRS